MKLQEVTIRSLTFLFFLFSGFTWVAGDVGQGLLGRLTIGDIAGAAVIFAALIQSAFLASRSVIATNIYTSYLPLVVVFFLGALSAEFPSKSAVELLIHLFIFGVSLALLNVYMRAGFVRKFEKLLGDVLLAGAVLAAIGLLHFFVFPQWFSGSIGGLSGTFRNTGQAGSFFGTYLAILVPAFLAGLIKPKLLNIALLGVLFLALAFTFKRAAIIGLTVGIMLLAFSMMVSGSVRDKKYSLYIFSAVILLAPLVIVLYGWGLENIDNMQWRVERKFGEDAAEQFSEGFIYENARSALLAFESRPLLGVGLGNVAGVFTQKYEVHSTYLKILACAGVMGVLAYCWFVWNLVSSLISRSKDVYSRYLGYMLPMVLGLLVSWAYTYHLRKREFWVLLAIISIAMVLRKRGQSAVGSPTVKVPRR